MNEFFAGFFLLQPPAEFEQKHNFLTISFSYFFMYHLAFFVCCQTSGDTFQALL